MLTHDEIMALSATGEARWGEQEAMLYALGAGMGTDPMDEQELPFVFEKRGEVKVLPTFPVVVGFHGGALKQVGVNYQMVLHGEQAVTLHRPFPASGRVTQVIDLAPVAAQVQVSDPEAVPNGIAWDAKARKLYVTGKNWPALFEIALPAAP